MKSIHDPSPLPIWCSPPISFLSSFLLLLLLRYRLRLHLLSFLSSSLSIMLFCAVIETESAAALHGRVEKEIKQLYDMHKVAAGYADVSLEIT